MKNHLEAQGYTFLSQSSKNTPAEFINDHDFFRFQRNSGWVKNMMIFYNACSRDVRGDDEFRRENRKCVGV